MCSVESSEGDGVGIEVKEEDKVERRQAELIEMIEAVGSNRTADGSELQRNRKRRDKYWRQAGVNKN
jgi:hypothetical protein